MSRVGLRQMIALSEPKYTSSPVKLGSSLLCVLQVCISFLLLPLKDYHIFASLNNTHLLSYSSVVWKSDTGLSEF